MSQPTPVSQTATAAALSVSEATASLQDGSSLSANALSLSSARAAATDGGPGVKLQRQVLIVEDAPPPGVVEVDLGTVTLGGDSPTETQPVVLEMVGTGRLDVAIATPPALEVVRLGRAVVRADYPSPVMIGTEAHSPTYRGIIVPRVSSNQAPGHIEVIADPDPNWGGDDWIMRPPPAPDGAKFWRWTTRAFVLPANAVYQLGARSAEDKTSAQPASTNAWAASSGSASAIAWNSDWPFKPTLSANRHFNPAGRVDVVEPAAIHFNSAQADHLWADFGAGTLGTEFTIMLVAIVPIFDTPTEYNYLLDAGRPTVAQLSLAQRRAWLKSGIDGPVALPAENGPPRAVLRVNETQVQAFTDPQPGTRSGRTPYHHTRLPHVFTLTVDGARATVSSRSRLTADEDGFVMQAREQRYLTIGRARGLIDPTAAANLTLLEVRVWDRALDSLQRDAHYDQLSSTWRFGAYK